MASCTVLLKFDGCLFLRSYAEGRWTMHANSVSGLQTSLFQQKPCEYLKFPSHFIWRSPWTNVGKWMCEEKISEWDQRSIEDFAAAEGEISCIMMVSQGWSSTFILLNPESKDSFNPRRVDFSQMHTLPQKGHQHLHQKVDSWSSFSTEEYLYSCCCSGDLLKARRKQSNSSML